MSYEHSGTKQMNQNCQDPFSYWPNKSHRNPPKEWQLLLQTMPHILIWMLFQGIVHIFEIIRHM